MNSYYRSIVNIGISRTVSEINGDIRQKSHENRQFSHTHVFNAPAEGVPRGIVYRRRGLKKLECFQKVENFFR